MAREDPANLEALLTTLAASNPDIVPLLAQHQDAFIRLLTSDDDEVGGAAGELLGVLPGPRPGTVSVEMTPADMEAIENVLSLFFGSSVLISILACCNGL